MRATICQRDVSPGVAAGACSFSGDAGRIPVGPWYLVSREGVNVASWGLNHGTALTVESPAAFAFDGGEEISSRVARGISPRAPSEPYVTVSRHTALVAGPRPAGVTQAR